MDIGVTNDCQYLYHYTRLDTAEDFILPNQNLRFSRYQKTNDPKERKDWFFSAGSNQGRDLRKYTPEYLSKIMNPVLKGRTHVLCFSTDGNLTGDHIADLPNRGFCMARMWAQYGDDHKGVCLVYGYKQLSESIMKQLSEKTFREKRVRYLDISVGEIITDPAYIVNIDCLEDWGKSEYAFSHGQHYFERLYFEKAKDWSGEREHRWVVFDSEEEIYVSAKRCLVGIMFGAEVDQKSINRIVELTKSYTIFYRQLKWRNCTPWYDYANNF